jgi:hypothetical protein
MLWHSELGVGAPPDEAVYPFDPSGGLGYVWHCHILEHEDNEMMRPFAVVPAAGAVRTIVEGTGPADY